MNSRAEQILQKHLDDINRINDQRRIWLWASSFIFTGIILIIFTWDWLDHFHSKSIWWVIISLMLLISINWWYWTMRVVRLLLHHHTAQHTLLKAVLSDLEEARNDIKFLVTETVDLPK